MKIILATSNKGKVRELKEAMSEFEILTYNELIEPFEIVEDGKTFKENALIKARVGYEKLKNLESLQNSEFIVLADDSGVSLPILGNKPGIYSARFAGEDATSKDNMLKVISELKVRKIKKTRAFYTASIAIVGKNGESTVHGWMHGDIIDEFRGYRGFGYDPIFIPNGYDKTLGELPDEVKIKLSHRSKAINLIKKIL